MLNRVNCGEMPQPITIGSRDNLKDVWLRTNVEEVIDEDGNKTYDCDEAYFRIEAAECPTEEDLEDNFEIWFEFAAEWKEPKPLTLKQLRADVDYLMALQE